jgi:hypothetical protein
MHGSLVVSLKIGAQVIRLQRYVTFFTLPGYYALRTSAAVTLPHVYLFLPPSLASTLDHPLINSPNQI